MADIKEISKLNKEELLEFAEKHNLMANLSEPLTLEDKKDDIVTTLAALATPEQVAEAVAEKEARKAAVQGEGDGNQQEGDTQVKPSEESTQSDPAVADPALGGEDDLVEEEATTFAIGDKVSYPYKEASNGRRLGRLLALEGDIATVRYADGSERSFGVAVLRKA